MIEKPPHGEACNSCGLCCMHEICPLGEILFERSRGPCPTLEWNGVKSACGLVMNPVRYVVLAGKARLAGSGRAVLSETAADLIGTGIGCDAQLEGETPNDAFREKLARIADESAHKTERAFKAWGIE